MQIPPVLVHLVRGRSVLAQFAPAGPLLWASAHCEALLAHFVRAGPFGAFAWAGRVPEHLAQPVLRSAGRAVSAQSVPVHFPGLTKPEIAGIELQRLADSLLSDSDRAVQKR